MRPVTLWRLSQTLPRRHNFTVFALESSADDSCAAVVTSERQILSNVVIRQSKELEENGGIHPYVAIQSHQRNLPRAVKAALEQAKIRIQDVDGIAFTRGPGIPGCLSVASNAANSLAAALGKPLVGVHHMQAHALTPLLTSPPSSAPTFPYLSLLISGGHTILVLTHSPRSFELLAYSDLNIGNAYDRVAKLLSILPHPDGLGLGAALERFCNKNPLPSNVQPANGLMPSFVVPSPKQLKFSYAGLCSAVDRYVKEHMTSDSTLDPDLKILLAHKFQDAAIAQLEEKTHLALALCRQRNVTVNHVVVSGGVASNRYLRQRLETSLQLAEETSHIALSYPPVHLCADNAAMIGWASMYRFSNNDHDPFGIELLPTWRIDQKA